MMSWVPGRSGTLRRDAVPWHVDTAYAARYRLFVAWQVRDRRYPRHHLELALTALRTAAVFLIGVVVRGEPDGDVWTRLPERP